MIVNVLKLFSSKEKMIFFYLVFLGFLSSILEVVGLGSLLPLLSAAINLNEVLKFKTVNYLYNFFGKPTSDLFIVYLSICVLVLFIVKSIVIVFYNNQVASFIWKKNVNLSISIFEKYLKNDINFHLTNNSAILIRNINNQISSFILYFLTPLMNLISACLLAIFLIGSLILYNFVLTMVIIIIIIGSITLFYLIVKNKISLYSKKNNDHSASLNLELSHGFGSIKESKILKIEQYFIDRFTFHTIENSIAHKKLFQINQLPKVFIEFILILSIL